MRVRRPLRPVFPQSVVLLLAAAGIAFLSGCVTPGRTEFDPNNRSLDETPQAKTADDPSRPSVAGATAAAPDVSPTETIEILRSVPDDGSTPLIVAGTPAAGYFVPVTARDDPPGERPRASDDPPDGRDRGVLIGAFTRGDSLLIRYRGMEAPVARESVLTAAEDFEVRSVSTMKLRADSPAPNGVRLLVWTEGYEEEFFVLATSSTPYVMRVPVSTVNRTQLQDLDGDGTQEMIRIAAIIDARGRRELMVDAYRWTEFGFEHAASLTLLRHLNDQLDSLDRRLRNDGDPAWRMAAAGALEPIEGSGNVARLLPATHVTIPEITDLSLDLGRRSWELSHEIAVEGSLYRVRILLYPNPLAQQPTRIVGIEGQ